MCEHSDMCQVTYDQMWEGTYVHVHICRGGVIFICSSGHMCMGARPHRALFRYEKFYQTHEP